MNLGYSEFVNLFEKLVGRDGKELTGRRKAKCNSE